MQSKQQLAYKSVAKSCASETNDWNNVKELAQRTLFCLTNINQNKRKIKSYVHNQ